jgi:hypothetical protein
MVAATADGNPLNKPRAVIADVFMGKGDNGSVFDAMGKMIGGQSFQDVLQAGKTFEAAFLPILSGAAVTPTEAQRLMRASVPQMGDSPETLRRKALNRQMMINGAARLGGKPPPFPDVAAMDFSAPQSSPAPQPGRQQANDALRARSAQGRAQGGGYRVIGVE